MRDASRYNNNLGGIGLKNPMNRQKLRFGKCLIVMASGRKRYRNSSFQY